MRHFLACWNFVMFLVSHGHVLGFRHANFHFRHCFRFLSFFRHFFKFRHLLIFLLFITQILLLTCHVYFFSPPTKILRHFSRHWLTNNVTGSKCSDIVLRRLTVTLPAAVCHFFFDSDVTFLSARTFALFADDERKCMWNALEMHDASALGMHDARWRINAFGKCKNQSVWNKKKCIKTQVLKTYVWWGDVTRRSILNYLIIDNLLISN